jgi:hypothetical protein
MVARDLCLVILVSALGACVFSARDLTPEGAGQGGEGAASVTASSGGATSPWWNDAFSSRVRISFNNPGEELTDFPLLVKLDNARFDYSNASQTGADLRFVDADGTTVLNYEIDRWSPDGDSFVWVKVPKIDGASTTDHIWLYYGNPDAPDAQQAALVWSGFVSVYHLTPSTATPAVAVDSTGKHPVTWSSEAGTIAGVAGDAADFNGTQAAETSDNDEFSADPNQARTIEVWVNARIGAEQLVLHEESQCKGWFVGIDADGSYRGHLSTEADDIVCAAYSEYLVTTPASFSAWRYVVLVIDRPNVEMRLFVDGTLKSSRAIDNLGDADGSGSFLIGTDWDHSNSFTGAIDEVRVSSSARSESWIAAQHKAMTDSFLRFDKE